MPVIPNGGGGNQAPTTGGVPAQPGGPRLVEGGLPRGGAQRQDIQGSASLEQDAGDSSPSPEAPV